MKTLDQILTAVKEGKKSNCLDGRDFSRLSNFFPEESLEDFGFELADGAVFTQEEFTEKNVIAKMKSDVDFGFEKALDKRGISPGFMYEVVKMWLWVLDDVLQYFDNYPMYGLPLFKAVALKYGFENQIGDDAGSENSYNEESYDGRWG